MPRLPPSLARLSLGRTTPTTTSTISIFRSIPTSIPTPTLLFRQAGSSRPVHSPSTSSLFTSPRSILSRLSPSVFTPQYTQIRTLAYGTTYQPSQRKRKRKYGFLARLKGGRLGMAILARRRIRGRRFLSH